MSSFQSEVDETARWLTSPRFEGLTRLYSARQVVEHFRFDAARQGHGTRHRRMSVRRRAAMRRGS